MLKIYSLLRHPRESLLHDVAEIMLKATNEERGTVTGLAALSQALDDEHPDGMDFLSSRCHGLLRFTNYRCSTVCPQSMTTD